MRRRAHGDCALQVVGTSEEYHKQHRQGKRKRLASVAVLLLTIVESINIISPHAHAKSGSYQKYNGGFSNRTIPSV